MDRALVSLGFDFGMVWDWLSSLIGKLLDLVLVLQHRIETRSNLSGFCQ